MPEDPHEEARLRDEEDRERFAIRREEAQMASEERALEQQLDGLRDDIEYAEQTVDADLRAKHYGYEPEHPPFWHKAAPGGGTGERGARRPPGRAGAKRDAS